MGATSGAMPAGAPGGTLASVSTGGDAAGGSQFRDKDPPPGYDGLNPELTFRQYEKGIKLWQFETDVPVRKQGAKMLRALTGSARLAVDDMEFDEITSEDGVKNILSRLREYYLPHLEISMPRAFETAVYGLPRQSKESFAEYVHRLERSFAMLTKEGVELPKGATGYILYRQASLTESQDQRVLTWCEGRYDRDSMVKALRRLDKVLKEKASKSNYVMDSESVVTSEHGNLPAEPYDDSGDEYIYVVEGDLDGIYEEQDMLEALASYREVRQALKEQKTNRGYFPGKGLGGGTVKGKGKGKVRIHKEQLKLRTRCWRCGQIGHISAECNSKLSVKESAGQSSSAASTSKSGFFVAMSDDTGSNLDQPSGQGIQDFWLRNFVERRAKTHDTSLCESDAAYKSARVTVDKPSSTSFHGIVTKSFEVVVDTAAEGGLIGSVALERLQNELKQFGLCCRWTPKTSSAKGVGGQAKVVGVILIPVGLGGINGVLEATVVEGDIPLLLPIRLLKFLGAIINIPENHIFFAKHAVKVLMKELHTGHMVINITEFAQEGFQTPQELGKEYDFKHNHEICDGQNAVMLAQQSPNGGTTSPRSAERSGSSFRNDGRSAGQDAKLGQAESSSRAEPSNFSASCSTLKSSRPQTLAHHDGQAVHSFDDGGLARRHRRLVPAIIGLGIVALVRDQTRGHLRGDHRECGAIEAFANQRSTDQCSERLCAPEASSEGRRQCPGFVDHMPRLQLPLGKSLSGGRDAERAQDREQPEEKGLLESNLTSYRHTGGDGSGCTRSGRDAECVPELQPPGQPDGRCRVPVDGNARSDDGRSGESEAANASRAELSSISQLTAESTGKAADAANGQRDEGEDIEARSFDTGNAEEPPRQCSTRTRECSCRQVGTDVRGRRLNGFGSHASPGAISDRGLQVRGARDEASSQEMGPTQGRSFWKCTRQICNFFQWDQAEVQRLLQMQPKAKASSAMTPSMPGSWQPVGGTTEVVDLTSESGF